MAVSDVPVIIFPKPSRDARENVGNIYGSLLLDASGEKVGMICQAPKSGNISKIHWRTATVTTPTDTDVRLETVDLTTGDPSGTLFDTNTNATVGSGSITSDTWFATTLTASAAVTRGDPLAVVIAPTGTPNYNIANYSSRPSPGLAYVEHFISAAWFTGINDNCPVFALEYDDGSFGWIPNAKPFSALSSADFNSGSSGDERGIKFRIGVPVRVSGAYAWFNQDNGQNTSLQYVLYDSDGSTVLASYTLDTELQRSGNAGNRFITFSSSIELLANTYYRLVLKPTDTVNVRNFFYGDVNSAAVMDALEGGQDVHYTERTDGGSWTDTTTRRPFMGLVIDGIDASGVVGGTEVVAVRKTVVG